MSPRTRRLAADYEALVKAFAGHPNINVAVVGAVPPERYRILYRVPGLMLAEDSRPTRTAQTIVDVYLPPDYPRVQPYLTAATPVFHPNFGSHVCIADYWAASQTLVDIVVQVGEMIQWRTYNTRSPLNAIAARWAVENTTQLPVGNLDVVPLRDDILLQPPRSA